MKGNWTFAAEHKILAHVFNSKGRHHYEANVRLRAASKAEADRKVAETLRTHHGAFLHKTGGDYQVRYECEK